MEQVFISEQQKLTALQIELLKGLRHMATEKQVKEVRALLRNYFAQQLDEAIEKVETEKGYTAATYESWAHQNSCNELPKAES